MITVLAAACPLARSGREVDPADERVSKAGTSVMLPAFRLHRAIGLARVRSTEVAGMTFRGWPVEALEFFEGLEADNSKTYWLQNRDVYDSMVRAPMEQLVEELAPEFGEGRIFRPYRDIRFSSDKSPYKTNIAAMIGEGYVQLTADALGAGSGMWQMAPDQLERYRAGVAEDRSGGKLSDVVATASAAGLEVTGHDILKSAPKGYPKDHPRIELLRYKGLITWREWPAAAWLGTRRAKDRVIEFFRLSKPLNVWLGTHVGPSTMPERRR
jgi:uncharacterized protein (TIGR02453 family)